MSCIARYLALAFAALVACASASAANEKWITLTNKYERFSITVPESCFVIPDDSQAKTLALISQLDSQGKTGLAGVYKGILSSTTVPLDHYAFEAFFYSPSAAIQPLFTLAVSTTKPSLTTAAGIQEIATSSAAALSQHGYSIARSRVVKLKAGSAAFVEGTQNVNGNSALVDIYTIGHGAFLYQFTFRTDSATRLSLGTFGTIVHRFADF